MLNCFDISGRKAIVTGAAGGLSRGIAEGLHEAGADVALIDISEKVRDAAKEIGASGAKAYAITANLTDRKALAGAFNEAVDLLGGLDILVNSAGIATQHKCEEYPMDEWDMVLELNVSALFQLSQLAGRIMLKQGSGKIINIASMNSFFGQKEVPSYVASKGAVAQLTKCLANEWAGSGINVNAIAPGYMATPMNQYLIDNPVTNDAILSRIPAGRWGTPDDMKYISVFLASDACTYLSGAIIPLDGGYMTR